MAVGRDLPAGAIVEMLRKMSRTGLDPEQPHGDDGRNYGDPADGPTRHIGRAVRLRPINHGVAPMVHDSLRGSSASRKLSPRADLKGSNSNRGQGASLAASLGAPTSPLVDCASLRPPIALTRPYDRTHTEGLLLIAVTFHCNDPAMSGDNEFDYRREAEAAMKMAAASSGYERLKWVRVAQAWYDLGRTEIGDGRVGGAPAGNQTRLKSAP